MDYESDNSSINRTKKGRSKKNNNTVSFKKPSKVTKTSRTTPISTDNQEFQAQNMNPEFEVYPISQEPPDMDPEVNFIHSGAMSSATSTPANASQGYKRLSAFEANKNNRYAKCDKGPFRENIECSQPNQNFGRLHPATIG